MLDDIKLFIEQPLGYAVEALRWLRDECTKSPSPSWATRVDAEFLTAVKELLVYCDSEEKDKTVLAQLRKDAITKTIGRISTWAGTVDPPIHPLAHLARMLAGNYGDHLELQGPLFTIVVGDVLEGLASNMVVAEWDFDDNRQAGVMFGLLALTLGEVAVSCYWAAKGHGTHLDEELRRLFSKLKSEDSLRGQLGNLGLASTALSWGLNVEFIPEAPGSRVKTPDWVTRDTSGAKLWVECTSSSSESVEPNDPVAVRKILAKVWEAKRE